MSDNLIPDTKLPFNPDMCMEQFATTIGYVMHMQDDANIEQACDDAMKKCADLFEGFYSSDNRMLYLAMVGYLAMDLAANVAHVIDRINLQIDLENEGQQ